MGPRLFEPVDGFFWSAVRGLRPDLDRVFQPWDRLSEPESLRSTLVDGGVPEAEIEIESGVHPLTTAEDAWSVVMGSGYRGTVDQLTPEQREQVRTETLAATRRASVREVETNVVYAIAHKRL